MEDRRQASRLWKSDGKWWNTRRVADIRPGQRGSDPQELTKVGDTLFFRAQTHRHGIELWKHVP